MDVNSNMSQLIKAIRRRINRIHQVTGRVRNPSPRPPDHRVRRKTGEGRDYLPCKGSSRAEGKEDEHTWRGFFSRLTSTVSPHFFYRLPSTLYPHSGFLRPI